MACPVCGTTIVVEDPTWLDGCWNEDDAAGVLKYECGYRRGSNVRRGDEFFARNGSRIIVMKTHPIMGYFHVNSVNLNNMIQYLWYDRDGHCLGPKGNQDWGGDDMIMLPHLTCRVADSECNGKPRLVVEVEDDGWRWDEI
jgi:hypothetical protein